MYTPFTDDKESLVLDFIRQIYSPELKAAEPSGYLYFLEGIKHFPEFVDGLFFILVTLQSPETVQFLIIIIFNLFADGSQQAVTFAGLMLAATFFGYLTRFGYLADLPAFQHLLQFLISEITGNGSDDAKQDNTKDNIPHIS